MTRAIEIKDLKFNWGRSDEPVIGIDRLTVARGEHLFIKGSSGTGKTTLLNLISGILKPREGDIYLLEEHSNTFSKKQFDKFRSDHMGIVFQLFNLLPYLSVIENITLPCYLSELRRQKALKNSSNLKLEASRLLYQLGLDKKIEQRKVTELSIGQQQRVAAARALIGSPELILADEPTSALDETNTRMFLELIISESEQNNSSLLFVSHNQALRTYFQNILSLDKTAVAKKNNKSKLTGVLCSS